mmetsp:Transcript_27812/g.80660  ORF Transcript_27812/g.80660 Transcript_27812/m.80660 type:complete len:224 (-) Transcript_27812:883-1554(-)
MEERAPAGGVGRGARGKAARRFEQAGRLPAGGAVERLAWGAAAVSRPPALPRGDVDAHARRRGVVGRRLGRRRGLRLRAECDYAGDVRRARGCHAPGGGALAGGSLHGAHRDLRELQAPLPPFPDAPQTAARGLLHGTRPLRVRKEVASAEIRRCVNGVHLFDAFVRRWALRLRRGPCSGRANDASDLAPGGHTRPQDSAAGAHLLGRRLANTILGPLRCEHL